LIPNYWKELKELKEIKRAEDEAYSSDLDVELTTETDVDVSKMKKNYRILVPSNHLYFK
jgi:hypothetical protein